MNSYIKAFLILINKNRLIRYTTSLKEKIRNFVLSVTQLWKYFKENSLHLMML